MNNEKLKQIIARQNEQLEYHAAEEAAQIIKEIAACQQSKIDADKEIAELRKRLKEIQVAQLDETSILGG
jgi:ppGpp synthetase/RelA/SpoT-type nucleotidyltranferase